MTLFARLRLTGAVTPGDAYPVLQKTAAPALRRPLRLALFALAFAGLVIALFDQIRGARHLALQLVEAVR